MKKIVTAIMLISGGLFLLERILGQDTDKRSYVYFDDMYQSIAYKAQSASPHVPTGLSQLTPPQGTIPRGNLPLHYGLSEDEMNRAGRDLLNPFAADTTINIERGQVVYQNFCLVCHGAGGEGDGLITKRGYPPPTSFLADQARNRADGQVFHIITYGYKNMPAYAVQVGREDRWHVIAYLRQLQQAALGAQAATEEAQ
jgi:mono/diheme cytochrome c family protein